MKIHSRLYIVICLIFAGSILSLIPQPLLGQSAEIQNWSSPILMGNGWWQSIAIDRMDQVHIGWYGGELANAPPVGSQDEIDLLTYRQRSQDGVWSPANDVIFTGLSGYTVRNALAATSDGMLHVVYRGRTRHLEANAPIIGATNAKNWTLPLEISPVGYYVNMTADSNDILHIVYSGGSDVKDFQKPVGNGLELNTCALCSDLFYLQSNDGGKTWSDPTPISIEVNSGSDRPDIFQGPSGRIYIVWDEGYDWYGGRGLATDVRIIYSSDSGLTWSKPIILDGGGLPNNVRPIQVTATEMQDGSLMAVWRYSNDIDRLIYYQISNDLGETWTVPKPVPGIFSRSIGDTPLDDYELKIDRLGSLHLFAVGVIDKQLIQIPSLYHIEYRNGIWQQPQRVFSSNQMRPEWPKAVIGSQNDIHLSWFIRIRRPDNIDDLKVYYSHLDGNIAQRSVSTFVPTLTALPTATVFQNFIPTETPFPTVTVKDLNAGVPNTDEYATETILGGLFMVGMFCLMVSLVYRFVIRR